MIGRSYLIFVHSYLGYVRESFFFWPLSLLMGGYWINLLFINYPADQKGAFRFLSVNGLVFFFF